MAFEKHLSHRRTKGYMLSQERVGQNVQAFVNMCRCSNKGQFASRPDGTETLYASSFAVMIWHYLGRLQGLCEEERDIWINYLSGFQDPQSGLFIGPEVVPGELTSLKHNYEHVTMHLTAHVLPALHLLGGRPMYPLRFAHRFLDRTYLQDWLKARDWKNAWLEGNNLLFVGQFLVYLRDFEDIVQAGEALDLYFHWLDEEQDPDTGLWGTNGYCSNFVAMCGGYHQLLMYYYCNRPIRYRKRLVDVVLDLQHPDGGFHPKGGGGACEDVDAVDILVNMYKQIDYRRPVIRRALRRALGNVLRKQMLDGGFVSRLNEDFMHMGIKKTHSPPNVSNMFATWFRIHTLVLIGEILTDEHIGQSNGRFNHICSMGWHSAWDRSRHRLTAWDRWVERFSYDLRDLRRILRRLHRKILEIRAGTRRIIGCLCQGRV